MTTVNPPEGFDMFPHDGTFADAVSPMFYQVDKEKITFAFQVGQKQSNIVGTCHGGALMTVMDFALSGAVSHAIKDYSGAPTISISMDFLDKANIGDWLFTEVQVVKITNTLGFAHGLIRKETGENIARASGSFKLPKKAKNSEQEDKLCA